MGGYSETWCQKSGFFFLHHVANVKNDYDEDVHAIQFFLHIWTMWSKAAKSELPRVHLLLNCPWCWSVNLFWLMLKLRFFSGFSHRKCGRRMDGARPSSEHPIHLSRCNVVPESSICCTSLLCLPLRKYIFTSTYYPGPPHASVIKNRKCVACGNWDDDCSRWGGSFVWHFWEFELDQGWEQKVH